MKRHVLLTASALSLVVGIWAITASSSHSAAADEGVKSAILELANGKGDPGAIAKKAELGDFMHLFKLRTKKGLGVGDVPGAVKPDGIEAKLMDLGKKANGADLAKNGAAYEKMGQIIVAIAKITDVNTPKENKAGKPPAAWKKSAEEMKSGGMELASAAKSGDAAKLKAAANKTITACNDCHGTFRD